MQDVVLHKDVGPKTKLAALEWWQNNGRLHPLTCGNDSTHNLLEGKTTSSGEVFLQCPDCDYLQFYLPDHVWRYYLKSVAFGVSTVSAPAGHAYREMGQ